MKFVAAILIAATLLGTVAWSQFALTRRVDVDVTREAHGHGDAAPPAAIEHFRLEFTPSFAAGADPFALRAPTGAARLRVSDSRGALAEFTQDIAAGVPVVVPDLTFSGAQAELFVEAFPSTDHAEHACALRIRLLTHEDVLCDEATLWSDGGGAALAGTVRLTLTPRLASVDRGLSPEGQLRP